MAYAKEYVREDERDAVLERLGRDHRRTVAVTWAGEKSIIAHDRETVQTYLIIHEPMPVPQRWYGGKL